VDPGALNPDPDTKNDLIFFLDLREDCKASGEASGPPERTSSSSNEFSSFSFFLGGGGNSSNPRIQHFY
jgi:hypothetical protein